MIFWRATKTFELLVKVFCVENVFHYYGEPMAKLFPIKRKGMLFPVSRIKIMPCYFTKNRAFIFENKIVIYGRRETEKQRVLIEKKFEITVVSENDDINSLPKKIAIKTDNIDLIRELKARGHDISWILPDLVKNLNILLMIKFEHLFLDADLNGNVAMITGRTMPLNLLKENDGKEGYFHFPVSGGNLRDCNKIGLVASAIFERLDRLNIFFKKKDFYYISKWKFTNYTILPKYKYIFYYNILSITYILCKKLDAMTAKKTSVTKE